eukprot:gene11278-23592_t
MKSGIFVSKFVTKQLLLSTSSFHSGDLSDSVINSVKTSTQITGNVESRDIFTSYSKNISKSIYPTLDCATLLDCACVIVKSPTPAEYEFNRNTNYTVAINDVNTEEVLFGSLKEQTNKSRWNKFLGGRIALRRALRTIGSEDAPSILRDQWGAPTLPSHITGSISHKDDLAVGIARVDSTGSVGIDLEHIYNKAASTLWRRILTEAEQSRLGRLPSTTIEEEVLLRFSFKEAVYKAIHPYLRRSVDFREVEVDPQPDGSADISFLLTSGELLCYKAYWQRYREKYWLSCVYVWDPKGTLQRLP